MKLAVLAFLSMPLGDAGAYGARRGRAGRRSAAIQDPGPHGFSEMLYAYTSATGNNGSAFAGLERQHRCSTT